MTQSVVERQARILVVEDNPLDVRMIRLALEEQTAWHTEIVVTEDGDRAVRYLTGEAGFADSSSRPDMVVLDLNLPKRDGTEVLRIIRSKDELKDMQVIVLSSLSEVQSQALVKGAHLTADGYLTKPSSVEDFLALGSALERYYRERLDRTE